MLPFSPEAPVIPEIAKMDNPELNSGNYKNVKSGICCIFVLHDFQSYP